MKQKKLFIKLWLKYENGTRAAKEAFGIEDNNIAHSKSLELEKDPEIRNAITPELVSKITRDKILGEMYFTLKTTTNEAIKKDMFKMIGHAIGMFIDKHEIANMDKPMTPDEVIEYMKRNSKFLPDYMRDRIKEDVRN